MSKYFLVPIWMASSILALSISNAQEPATAQLCNESGVCTVISPEIGLAILVASTFEKNINENIKASGSESGELAKALKIVSGISAKDIEKYGLCGGKHSEARKIFGKLCPDNVK